MMDQPNRDYAGTAHVQDERRRYVKPRLVDLGDVRELTLGTSGTSTESHSQPAKS
jgi:hypothetical protein